MDQFWELFLDFFATYGWQLTLIAVAGVMLLGILKYCKVFDKFEEDTRHFLYLLISVGLSIVGSVIYLACIHQLDVALVFPLAAAIWFENQAAYTLYDSTPLRKFLKMLWDKILAFAASLKGDKDDETDEPETPPEEVVPEPITVDIPVAVTGLVYNGQEQVGVAASDLYTVTNGSAINAGQYTATVMLKDTTNYKWVADFNGEVIYIIAKADYDMTHVSMEDLTVSYDGKAHSITINGDLPEGVSVSYESNNKVDSGKYTVTASFTGDELNHNAIAAMTATLTIEKASPKVVPVIDSTKNIYPASDFPAITLADGSTDGTISWEEGQALTVGIHTYSWRFVPTDTTNYITVVDVAELTVVEAIEQDISNTISFEENAPATLSVHLPALGKATFAVVGTDTYDIKILSTYGVTGNSIVELMYRVDGKPYLPMSDDYTTEFEIDKQQGYFVVNCTPELYRYNKLLARKWGSEVVTFQGSMDKEYTYKMEVSSASGQKVTVYLEQE